MIKKKSLWFLLAGILCGIGSVISWVFAGIDFYNGYFEMPAIHKYSIGLFLFAACLVLSIYYREFREKEKDE